MSSNAQNNDSWKSAYVSGTELAGGAQDFAGSARPGAFQWRPGWPSVRPSEIATATARFRARADLRHSRPPISSPRTCCPTARSHRLRATSHSCPGAFCRPAPRPAVAVPVLHLSAKDLARTTRLFTSSEHKCGYQPSHASAAPPNAREREVEHAVRAAVRRRRVTTAPLRAELEPATLTPTRVRRRVVDAGVRRRRLCPRGAPCRLGARGSASIHGGLYEPSPRLRTTTFTSCARR